MLLCGCYIKDDLYDGRGLSDERSLSEAGEWVWKERDLWNAFLRGMNDTEYLTDEDSSIMCINIIDWTTRYLQAAVLALLFVAELCSSAAAVWILRRVRELSSQSAHARQMHLQLTRLLQLQVKLIARVLNNTSARSTLASFFDG